jgi:membrane fusion protein (multidrug efflux system)
MIQMLAAVIAVVGVLGFVKFQQIQMAIAAGKSYQPPPEAVTTIVATQDHWQSTVDAVGSVAPVQGVTLSADLPGVVDKILFTSGARVATGDVLVRLDTRQEEAQLASADAQLDLAKINLDRSQKLLEQQAISQAEYDQTAAQFKQAQASVHEFQANIDRKTIRAPFAGVAGIRLINLGQYLHSGDPVVPLQSLDPIYVNFAVPQRVVGELRAGDSVKATADSGSFTGRITAINPVVDDATRNVQVQATFENGSRKLHPGMYVTVSVLSGERTPVVALPASAINYAPYGNSVFIVEDLQGPDGKTYRGVRQQFVKLGTAMGDQVAVIEGVQPGQEIVTSGVFKLRTGASVIVNNKVQPSNNPSPKPENS